MFSKVLIANRGEIAVRVLRACRDLGIDTVTVYDPSDIGSLHVRLADESVQLTSPLGYLDTDEILRIARDTGAQAIHPGYGFLAEDAAFARACAASGIVYIGPSIDTLDATTDKVGALNRARAAGFPTTEFSERAFGPEDDDALNASAEKLGFPLVVRSCRAGRGHGIRLVRSREQLASRVRHTRSIGQALYHDPSVYLEQAILPSRYIEVQVIGDQHGNLVQLGERDGSLMYHNQKIFEEAPAPGLSDDLRARIWQAALDIARLFGCSSSCTVEFVLDSAGNFLFTEIKPRLQVEHPLSEMMTRIDIVREQIMIANGAQLSFTQDDVRIRGSAMICRINAEDPWNNYLPSPGRLGRLRLPGGPNVRVDTYAYGGCDIPTRYDSLIAKLTVWGSDRDACLRRMRRALDDLFIQGVQTNLALIQQICHADVFVKGTYTTEFARQPLVQATLNDEDMRNLAVAAAVAFLWRNNVSSTSTPDRFISGWHRDSRRLPS